MKYSTQKNLEKLFWILATFVLVMIPIYVVVSFLMERDTTAKRGEVLAEFWLPKDCTVLESEEDWDKKFPDRPINTVTAGLISFADYKAKLGNEPGHYAVLTPSKEEVTYKLWQGKVLISVREPVTGTRILSASKQSGTSAMG